MNKIIKPGQLWANKERIRLVLFFENIRCKHSIQGQKCTIDGCYDPEEINRNSNLPLK